MLCPAHRGFMCNWSRQPDNLPGDVTGMLNEGKQDEVCYPYFVEVTE